MGRMKQNVGDLIILGTITVVLSQHAKIVNDSQILIDDVLLGGWLDGARQFDRKPAGFGYSWPPATQRPYANPADAVP